MVAKLVCASLASLDGYVVDAAGSFDWAEPDEEVHAYVNDLERPIGTYLYGRRLYEVMRAWETMAAEPDLPPVARDYAQLWLATEKVVFSSTLTQVTTTRTRLERAFDPATVAQLKRDADRDISIGGPTLAAHAWRAGLVDECHLFLNPVIVGGGTRALPDHVRADLELVDEHRFASGVVHLHHRVRH